MRGDAPCLVSDWPRELRAFPARPAASLAPLSCAHAHLALAPPPPTPHQASLGLACSRGTLATVQRW